MFWFMLQIDTIQSFLNFTGVYPGTKSGVFPVNHLEKSDFEDFLDFKLFLSCSLKRQVRISLIIV
jgi:hypothetical protein